MVTSTIKDTTDFLCKLPTQITDKNVLCTFDIVSLYTSIPSILGIEALNFWYAESDTNDLIRRFPLQFYIDALNIINNNNIFVCNKQFYKQLTGVAMGAKVSATYAILTIGFLEHKLYKNIFLLQ